MAGTEDGGGGDPGGDLGAAPGGVGATADRGRREGDQTQERGEGKGEGFCVTVKPLIRSQIIRNFQL